MSNDKKLTASQVEALKPYEHNFKCAVEAAWSPYPGQAGIKLMLDTWAALTGRQYPYKPGCPHCLMNLVRDMGTIYFAQKKALEETPAKADSLPAEGTQKVEAVKTTAAKKKTAKSKK